MENLTKDDTVIQSEGLQSKTMQRRSFLRYAGAGAAGVGIMAAAACKKHDATVDPTTASVDVGSGDIGVLNFAYGLEQLEAAFYTQVIKTPYTGMTAAELSALTDIRDHEVLHREFLKAALSTSAIIGLTVDFSSIDFTSRTSVLGAAKAFEDTGVSAYNGAGYLITNPTYLTLAGKIVSVEARHAAFIRDLIASGTFADSTVLDANALDTSRKPSQVLVIANAYLKTKLTANQLP